MGDEYESAVCQWTSWAESADCDNEPTRTMTFHGREIEVCDHHYRVLQTRQ